MLAKLQKAFNLLANDVKDIQAQVNRLNVRPVVKDGKDGKDGVSPDVELLVKQVLSKIPTPKDGRDGRDGDSPRATDIADIVLSKIPTPKDGRDGRDGDSPDTELLVKEVVAQTPTPRNGRDGRDGKDGKQGLKGDKGDKGDKGEPGKDGASITDVKLEKGVLSVWIDGVKNIVGRINVVNQPPGSFTPTAVGGSGASNRVNTNRIKEVIVEVSDNYTQRDIDDKIIGTGPFELDLIKLSTAFKSVQLTCLPGSGTIIITPSGSELIDGAPVRNLAAGQSITITPTSGGWVTG